MKEIKFRGKRVDTGEWIYGDLLHWNNKAAILQWDDTASIDIKNRLVISSTVGEFTGLLDKTGKEIFEGDILKFGDFVWTVEWKNDRLGFGYLESADRMLECDGDHCEVIGNIHEKKEGESNG